MGRTDIGVKYKKIRALSTKSPDEDDGARQGVRFSLGVGVADCPDIGASRLADTVKPAIPAMARVHAEEDLKAGAAIHLHGKPAGRVEKKRPENIIVPVAIGGKGIGEVDVVVTFYKLDGFLGLDGSTSI